MITDPYTIYEFAAQHYIYLQVMNRQKVDNIRVLNEGGEAKVRFLQSLGYYVNSTTESFSKIKF